MVSVIKFSSVITLFLLWCFKCVKLELKCIDSVISASTSLRVCKKGQLALILIKNGLFKKCENYNMWYVLTLVEIMQENIFDLSSLISRSRFMTTGM